MALESIEGEQIPVRKLVENTADNSRFQFYYFARDDRVFKAFTDRINAHQAAIRRALSRRLKWQFRVLQKVLEGRSTTYRVSERSAHYPLTHSSCHRERWKF